MSREAGAAAPDAGVQPPGRRCGQGNAGQLVGRVRSAAGGDVGSWARGMPGQGMHGGEVLGTAWEASGLRGLEGSQSDGMETVRPRKVLGLCDAVGITGDEYREGSSLAVARLAPSAI